MITFDQGKARFNHRVAGIALNGDRVLIHRAEMDDFWSLPGGRVSMLESTADALKREMQEELGVEIYIERLVWVVENFFEHDGRDYHELAFYYLMAFPHGSYLYDRGEPFSRDEEGIKLIFRWRRLDELGEIPLYPSFLQEKLSAIPETIEHIVHIDP